MVKWLNNSKSYFLSMVSHNLKVGLAVAVMAGISAYTYWYNNYVSYNEPFSGFALLVSCITVITGMFAGLLFVGWLVELGCFGYRTQDEMDKVVDDAMRGKPPL